MHKKTVAVPETKSGCFSRKKSFTETVNNFFASNAGPACCSIVSIDEVVGGLSNPHHTHEFNPIEAAIITVIGLAGAVIGLRIFCHFDEKELKIVI